VAGPRTLAPVRACAAAVEAGLALQVPNSERAGAATGRPAAAGPARAEAFLQVMGSQSGLLSCRGQDWQLSRRHTELLWLLASRPAGLSAQALDVALHLDGEHLITVRAEINRLRRVLGAGLLESRPYRLTVPVVTDVDRIRAGLAEGRLTESLTEFGGAPLPGSDAPGIRSMSEEFTSELRQAVLDSGSAVALESWTARPEGHDDVAAWQALESVLPPGSPRRAQARAHLRRLG